MKKTLSSILLFVCLSANAADFKFIIPTGPGTTSDAVARAIQDEYQKQTGKHLIIDYTPGADQILSVSKFKLQNKPSLILGSSTMHVLNPIFKPDLPYTNQDFYHVAWVGWNANVYFVRTDSAISSTDDFTKILTEKRNITIGGDNMSTQLNVKSLQKKYGAQHIQMVPYHSSTQTLNDLLGGHIDIAIGVISPTIVAQAEAGKIRFLASTHDKPLMVAGQIVPPAESIFKTPQFRAFFLVNRTLHDTPEAKQLAADIQKVVSSPSVIAKLKAINLEVEAKDGIFGKQMIDHMTAAVKQVAPQ